jgi:hypothetical protein
LLTEDREAFTFACHGQAHEQEEWPALLGAGAEDDLVRKGHEGRRSPGVARRCARTPRPEGTPWCTTRAMTGARTPRRPACTSRRLPRLRVPDLMRSPQPLGPSGFPGGLAIAVAVSLPFWLVLGFALRATTAWR